jgi:hypothetical protein
MKTFDAITRAFVLAQGSGKRWLRRELEAREVSIPVTAACLTDLVRAADTLVRQQGAEDQRGYVERLRAVFSTQADFIHRWTATDEKPEWHGDEILQGLVRISREHALPRRWKLTEPVVKEYQRKRPSYFQWTDDLDTISAAP